ncbi:MAG: NAD(P)H-hydrate epimerase [Elusimicrobiaceae bacterium]
MTRVFYNGLPSVTAAEMRRIDRTAMEERGIPAALLMENAGRLTAFELGKREQPGSAFAILCGKGNNGGDGLVCARYLAAEKFAVKVFIVPSAKYNGLVEANLLRLREAGVCAEPLSPENFGIIAAALKNGAGVDCLLGTGTLGKPQGVYADAITLLNENSRKIYAVDIPSGLNPDDGTAEGVCVTADETFTLGLAKTGLINNAGKAHAGLVTVLDIGFPRDVIASVLGL